MARDNLILALCGFNVTGDLGPISVYRSRRGALVFYPRVPALSPPTTLQLIQRNRFRAAAISWQGLPEETRAQWEAATIAAKLAVTGYNLFTYYQMTGDVGTLRTITNHTGIPLVTEAP